MIGPSSEEVAADALVFELGNITVGYADEEAPPPDVDFRTSARIMATVTTTPPIERSTMKVRLNGARLRISVRILRPPCDLAYRVHESSPIGEYRDVYEIEDDKLIILVLRVGHRSDVCR